MNIGIVAGEASGDLLGASLIKAFKVLHPDIKFVGIGGPAMQAAGCKSLYEMERLSVMGLVEPLFHLPDLFKIRRGLYQYFTTNKPDVFIGIDSPDFNIGLELNLHKAGVRTVHYVSPSVWAWRKKRVFKIAKAVDLILTLLPFEAEFYKDHHVPVKFVGHPLADVIPLQPDKLAARQKLGLDEKATYIAVLPGSRRHEIQHLAPVFIETAYRCWQQKTEIRFITSAANAKRHQEFQDYCKKLAPNLPIQFFEGQSHDVMAAADVVLVASGTATLETMLYKRPMVIAYRIAGLTFQIAKHLVKIPFIGLPNLLANELLVPEFIQDAADPEKMSAALMDFLNHPEKIKNLENKFTELHQQLKLDASHEAATAILQVIKK
jgi:lipid-A-disaccharide synthase